MRVLLRVGLAFVVLIAVAFGALALLMPRIVGSDAVRARIEQAGADALGREFRYSDLDFGLLPPSLLILDPSVAGDSADAAPFAMAERVALEVALAPLLARAVVVDSFVVEGAVVRLVRDADGVSLPGPRGAPPPATPVPRERAAASAPDASRDPSASAAGAKDAPPFDLAVRSVELRNTTLIFEDRVVSPPHTLTLRDIRVVMSGESLAAPIPFEVSATLERGGSLAAGGTTTLDGDLDLGVELAGIALAAFRPYFGTNLEADGALSGTITARGPLRGAASIGADLSLAEARLRVNEIELQGFVAIKAEVEGGFSDPRGRFDVDATRSDLRLGGAFHKPVGKPATVSGRIVTGSEGVSAVEDVNLQIGTARARGRVSLLPRTRVVAQIAPFDLEGWEEMVPALAEYRLKGPLRFDEITVTPKPLDLRGRVHLEGVTAQIPDQGPVRVTGAIEAVGDEIHSRGLSLVAAEQEISIEASLTQLNATPRYRVVSASRDIDTNRLVTSLTSRRDTFFGLLDFDGEFSGELGEAPPLKSLHGLARIDISNGRIVGLSLLHSLFNALGEVGATLGAASKLALGAAPLFTGKDLERYYGDEFKSLAGTLQLSNGVASTNDMRLLYRDYSVDLSGSFDLEATSYRLLAELTLGKQIDEALAGGKVDEKKPPMVIPFPARGRLDQAFAVGSNPSLALNREIVAGLVSHYGLARHRDDAAKAIDKVIGKKGAGGEVVDILDGILGGAKKSKSGKN